MLTQCQYYKKCCNDFKEFKENKCNYCTASKKKKKMCKNITTSWNCLEFQRIPKTWIEEHKQLYNNMIRAYKQIVNS